jgi:hypothetical protein
MVDFGQAWRRWTEKREGYETMEGVTEPFAAFVQANTEIAMPGWLRPENATNDSSLATQDAFDTGQVGDLIDAFVSG